MILPKLYGISSTGKVKEWEIHTLDKEEHSEIITVHGYSDGKKTNWY